MRKKIRFLILLALIPLTTGCDQLIELLELPNPAKEAALAEAEGQAIGSACRHAGRSLEDCYILNPSAQKAAVFAGWRSMNDYMMENKLEVVPSQLQTKATTAPEPAAAAPAGTPASAPPAKAGGH
ncbi:MAG: hypothetical protein CVU19_13145 [Betaproteobacteria bacterium HGW-Betaproteobacteria-13]|uniref:Uncharacterized protein n=1 Tax=Parazoarcus communis TaxID=41977 RepID=A0A2U8H784_9RHOO|nr:hypothetical protein [Parazoarcus communis]AWI81837.1 hypothetical protein CEW87_00310 [Parazoarcus communis]PKO57438.1 MAG: hypothetical protein CVU25_08170 [Betaproteobacteria bacterium HGW-Betaproteobacteria-19]PKO80301.1 MAG: hypothetical protein CVU19_13145 [Betaproteobacteria bacterium HGW-Betaproteobacteria-13]